MLTRYLDQAACDNLNRRLPDWDKVMTFSFIFTCSMVSLVDSSPTVVTCDSLAVPRETCSLWSRAFRQLLSGASVSCEAHVYSHVIRHINSRYLLEWAEKDSSENALLSEGGSCQE